MYSGPRQRTHGGGRLGLSLRCSRLLPLKQPGYLDFQAGQAFSEILRADCVLRADWVLRANWVLRS